MFQESLRCWPPNWEGCPQNPLQLYLVFQLMASKPQDGIEPNDCSPVVGEVGGPQVLAGALEKDDQLFPSNFFASYL